MQHAAFNRNWIVRVYVSNDSLQVTEPNTIVVNSIDIIIPKLMCVVGIIPVECRFDFVCDARIVVSLDNSAPVSDTRHAPNSVALVVED